MIYSGSRVVLHTVRMKKGMSTNSPLLIKEGKPNLSEDIVWQRKKID